MNTSRLFILLAWVASVVAAYFIGGGGDSVRKAEAAVSEEQAAHEAATHDKPVGEPHLDETTEGARRAKPDVRLLVARTRLEMGNMGGMMNIRGMLRAMAPITELDDAQVQEALAEVEASVREPQQQMMLYSLLLGQWAETDGRAAMTYAQTKLVKGSMLNMGLSSSVLTSWASRDPEGAWKWFTSEQPDDGTDRTREMSVTAIFAGMAGQNLDAALARVSTLDEAARNAALNGIANGMAGDAAARRRLIDRTASLPPEQGAQLRQSLVGQWAWSNPDEAVAWIRSLPAEEQKPLRTSAGQRIMNVKPALGAELALEGAEEKDKPQIYEMVASQWAYMDARAAGDWLTKQPQGPELDGARTSYARVIMQRDPAAALDWARSVQDEQKRTESVTSVYQLWRVKDAAAAEAALTAAGLPPALLKQIREAPSPEATKATPSVRSYGK